MNRDNLRTDNYRSRRKRRGCFRFFFLIIVLLLLVSAFSKLALTGLTGLAGFKGAVGVVRIEGPINESTEVVRIIRTFAESSVIKAIVVRLDTPGGAVGASEEIYRELERARKKENKIVVASMGNTAASGGYYVAAAADRIFANAGTLTGSIGVIAWDWNFRELLRKIGVQPEVLKSGEHKDTGSPLREMTPEDRRLLQHVIFDVYRQFFSAVLKTRHQEIEQAMKDNPDAFRDALVADVTKNTTNSVELQAFATGTVAAETGATTDTETALRTIADGRILTGQQALNLGLVDEIGSLQDAIEYASKKADLGDDPLILDKSPDARIPALLGAWTKSFWGRFTDTGTQVRFQTEGD